MPPPSPPPKQEGLSRQKTDGENGRTRKRDKVADVANQFTDVVRRSSAEVLSKSSAVQLLQGNLPKKVRSKASYNSDDVAAMDPARRIMWRLIFHPMFDSFMGIIIVLNIGVMMAEADYQAACESGVGSCAPKEIVMFNIVVLAIYTFEALGRLYVMHFQFFLNGWCWLDSIIVLMGYVDFLAGSGEDSVLPVDGKQVQMLRILRVFRLLRAVRLLRMFPELYLMVQGFKGAVMAMLWGMIMIFILLMLWSLVYVELINEYSRDFNWAQYESEGDWCRYAFSGIGSATLLLFQTLVAGDSWGACLVPLIRSRPHLLAFFAPSLICITLGFTNLILAAIVDRATKARLDDEEEIQQQKKRQEQEIIETWGSVLAEIDQDGDGDISLEEIVDSYQNNPMVAATMSMLDIEEGDLEKLFFLMDEDGSGSLGPDEFVGTIRKAQSQDQRMYLMFMRLQVAHIARMMEAHQKAMATLPQMVSECLRQLQNGSRPPSSAPQVSPSMQVLSPTDASTAAAAPGVASDRMAAPLCAPVVGHGSAPSPLFDEELQRLQKHLDVQFEAVRQSIRKLEVSLDQQRREPQGSFSAYNQSDNTDLNFAPYEGGGSMLGNASASMPATSLYQTSPQPRPIAPLANDQVDAAVLNALRQGG